MSSAIALPKDLMILYNNTQWTATISLHCIAVNFSRFGGLATTNPPKSVLSIITVLILADLIHKTANLYTDVFWLKFSWAARFLL